ncbi:phage tail sheath subtilisin-like domain-containing protein [Nonomuraea sp. B5E05]|uniref:phage tail sheath family protein n=1 Tax=Nonomuraea sp. B5E05 TaxID=3153569 RepID=UPI00326008BD
MAVTLSHPGVYIQEIPGGSRTITGVATAVTAFVGRALRGPVDVPVPISSYAEFERTFGGLWRDSGLGYAVRDFYLNGGNQAVIVRLARNAATALLDLNGALSLEALGAGAWGNALNVQVEHAGTGAEAETVADQQGVEADDLFHLIVREGPPEDPVMVEAYPNVTLVDGPRRVDLALAGSRLVKVARATALPGTGRPDEGNYGGAGTDPAVTGTDGDHLTAGQYTGGTLEDTKKGIYALRDADLFTLLCLPPSVPDLKLDDSVWAAALDFCTRQRAFLLVDPPPDANATTIRAWVQGRGLTAQGRNGAVYFPRLRRPDPLRDGAIREFAPCGAVAGVMARTDAARGVWKASAGVEAGLAGVTGPAITLTDGENGALNPMAINCLRTFRGVGTVIWGARTLRGADVLADEYRYVPVRRLALFLEETLVRATQWAVFEPNDEPLWAQIRASIGGFLQDLFRQGAFQGRMPREAYFVKCDSETTTQYDIDRGVLNIMVGFAAVKPAEFVVISIQQRTAAAGA